MKKTGKNTNKTNKTKPMITSKQEPNKKDRSPYLSTGQQNSHQCGNFHNQCHGFHMKLKNLRNLFSCIKALRRVTKISAQKPDPDCVLEKILKESKQEGKKIAKL